MSGDISINLSRHEMACKCGCGFDTVDVELADALQAAVYAFEVRYGSSIRLEITGGNRCIEHNEAVQKRYNKRYVPHSSRSPHIIARAADHALFIRATGNMIDPSEVASYYEQKYPTKYGIGKYDTFVHLDTKTGLKRRWDNRT